jgi:dCMP deaminase
MKTIVIAYVPVLHDGYRQFFAKHKEADVVYVFGPEIIKKFDYLAKEIRALDPELIRQALHAWGISNDVVVLNEKNLQELSSGKFKIVTPNEDVARELIKEYFPKHTVEYDAVFLRWDKHKAMEERPVEIDQKISRAKFDRELIGILKTEAQRSSDWWRRIASAIVKDGEVVLTAYNEHLPSPHSPYANGDPRNALHKGVGIEYSTAIHSEARLVAEAARRGIALEGASLYATVFPCPPCTKQIAFSGIKKLYYAGGYTVLDQDVLLKQHGIEIIYVEESAKK